MQTVLQNTHKYHAVSGAIVAANRAIPGLSLAPVEGVLPVEQWYALAVRVRYEKLVSRHLEYDGFHHFLPLFRSVRRWKDRRKELDLALFPGYLFVRLKLGSGASVLRSPGVRQFVTFQGQPAVVPEAEIRALESSFAAGLHPQPHPYLHQGRRVRVKRGALMGTEGILIRRKEGFRLVLSIELIMRSLMLEVDEADVEPI
jgi:transcription antitermination factor NusG